MMNRIVVKRGIILFCFLQFINITVFAQDTARIFVRAQVQKEAILLRWGASTPLAWKQTNRSGFRIERYTVIRDTQLLAIPEKVILGEGTMKAKPMDQWMPLVESNDNAGIIAQALYGDDFQLTGGDAQGLARIVNLAQELEQRFTFSLYAADQDFEMACMAGWGWRDYTVKKGERYLYRIIPATLEDSARIVMGSVYTSLDEYKELPEPIELVAVWSDKTVILSWAYGPLINYYNSYYIEKSTDGKIFRRLPGRPISNLSNKNDRVSETVFYVDSLPDNTQTFYYRVRGITPFGEIGPLSQIVTGKGITTLLYIPVIRKAIVNDKGKLDLEWEFDERGNELLEKFELKRSDKADGTYETVVSNISPARRSIMYDSLESGNYFIIEAIPFEGKSRRSYPVLVQPLDTIPPLKPSGARASIDSTGRVTLTWNQNTEKDLSGYLVYRSHIKQEEPHLLVNEAITDTCFIDRVEIANLNPEVYYYIVAVDKRYNQSEFSDRLDLVKPDIIPPVSPLISDYHITSQGIEIQWIPSPDNDVMQHCLYRQDKKRDSVSTLVVSLPGNTIDKYIDTSYISGATYVYSIFAVDKSGLKSAATPPITIVAPSQKSGMKQIDRFDGVVDKTNLLIKLLWSNNLSDVQSYEIYRSEGEAPMTLWKVLPGWQTEIIDDQIAINFKYSYMIRALFENGGNSSVKSLKIR